MWGNVDAEISKRLEEELNKLNDNVDHVKIPPSQGVLAAHRSTPWIDLINV
jgi:hypothetical protein